MLVEGSKSLGLMSGGRSGRSLGLISGGGSTLRGDLFHDACNVTYLPLPMDRQMPVKNITSPNFVSGGNEMLDPRHLHKFRNNPRHYCT